MVIRTCAIVTLNFLRGKGKREIEKVLLIKKIRECIKYKKNFPFTLLKLNPHLPMLDTEGESLARRYSQLLLLYICV